MFPPAHCCLDIFEHRYHLGPSLDQFISETIRIRTKIRAKCISMEKERLDITHCVSKDISPGKPRAASTSGGTRFNCKFLDASLRLRSHIHSLPGSFQVSCRSLRIISPRKVLHRRDTGKGAAAAQGLSPLKPAAAEAASPGDAVTSRAGDVENHGRERRQRRYKGWGRAGSSPARPPPRTAGDAARDRSCTDRDQARAARHRHSRRRRCVQIPPRPSAFRIGRARASIGCARRPLDARPPPRVGRGSCGSGA